MFPLLPSVKKTFTCDIARKEDAILLQIFIHNISVDIEMAPEIRTAG